MTLIRRLLTILIITSITVACGGGGSENSTVASSATVPSTNNTVVTNNPPVINAPTNVSTKENTYTEIDASQSTDSDGSINRFEWRQISGQFVSLQNINSDKVSFTTPEVSQNQMVVLELTITDNDNASTTSQVEIIIEDTTLKQPIISLQRSGNNVQVSWDDANADSYRLIFWQDGARPLELNTSSTILSLDNLSSGTYNVMVEAYDSLGHSIFSRPSQIGV